MSLLQCRKKAATGGAAAAGAASGAAAAAARLARSSYNLVASRVGIGDGVGRGERSGTRLYVLAVDCTLWLG